MISWIAICTRHQSDNFKWHFCCWWISQKKLREKQGLSNVIFRFRCYYTVILLYVQQFVLFLNHIFGTLQVLKLYVSWDFWILCLMTKLLTFCAVCFLVHFKQLGGVHQTHLPLHLLNFGILTCYEFETCTNNAPW